MYEKYRALADAENHVIFGGRLGTYRYLDMHQVVAEALGITLPHAALAPSGQPIWRDMARRSARALVAMS